VQSAEFLWMFVANRIIDLVEELNIFFALILKCHFCLLVEGHGKPNVQGGIYSNRMHGRLIGIDFGMCRAHKISQWTLD
jgi:hypothetical protein